MRHTILSAAAVLLATFHLPAAASVMIGLEDVSLPIGESLDAASDPASDGIASQGTLFHWAYDTQWQIASGFAISTISDTSNYQGNEPWRHPYNAIPGSGSGGSETYAVAFASPPALIDIPNDPVAIDVTNTTYAYYSMRYGDEFAKQFGGPDGQDPDWFRLTISGLDSSGTEVGSVTSMLADFRPLDDADDYILQTWKTVDLSSLAGARRLQLALDSSDTGPFGINTPAYVAVDNLVVVPEPLPVVPVVLGTALVWWTASRRRQKGSDVAIVLNGGCDARSPSPASLPR